MTSDSGPAAPTDSNADQVAYWNSVAGERWAERQAQIDALFAPMTETVLDFAAPKPGTAVLDIGCGAGATVLALARRVGPSGRVTGVDISKPLLDVASRRLATEVVQNASVMMADAETKPFEPQKFDLAFSRFGVMFFADPVAAFRNIRSALVEGGRLAFVCWQPLAANAFFAVPAGAIKPLLPPAPPPDPHAPGPFAFADPDRVRKILVDAGFSDVAITPHRMTIQLGPLSDAIDFLMQIGPAARAIGETEREKRPPLIEALRKAVAEHDSPEGIALGGAVWLVAAKA